MSPTDKNMAVKVLYSMEHEKFQFVAKPSNPFLVSVHTDFNIGFCRLDKCLEYLVHTCTDLESGEFSVYSIDCSEENAPLLAHGKLTNLMHTLDTVSGVVKTNLLNQAVFEVKLHFKKCEPAAGARHIMPPSSPPPVKRFCTMPATTHQVRPEFSANVGNGDGPIVRSTYNPRGILSQQTPHMRVPKCANCGTFETQSWRWAPDSDDVVLCNACGLWPKTHEGKMRPETIWEKAKTRRPHLWKVRPESQWAKGNSPFANYNVSIEEYVQANGHPPKFPKDWRRPTAIGATLPSSPQPRPEHSHTQQHLQEQTTHNIHSMAAPVAIPMVSSSVIAIPPSPIATVSSLSSVSARTQSPDVQAAETPVSASRQSTITDKENQPPNSPEAPLPTTPPQPIPEAEGTESHHKFMARYIHSTDEGLDIFEAFMRSPSRHPSRSLDIELSSALSSSPPTSVFDTSEQELTADWFRKPTDKPVVGKI